MEAVVNTISQRIANYIEQAGLIQRDMDNTFLDLPMEDEDSLLHLQAASVSYRIAVGPDTGKKVFTLQTLPTKDENNYGQLAQISGFSLHAGVFADSHQTEKLERLCRYISRPAISEHRLSLTDSGKVRYKLKTPYDDGTTHVFFSPLDFIGKLAALIPPPRLNLTRFYGVFAPNSHVRAEVTASQRGKHSPRLAKHLKDSEKPYHARNMSWAQRLKRVFNIDITGCEACEKPTSKSLPVLRNPLLSISFWRTLTSRLFLAQKTILLYRHFELHLTLPHAATIPSNVTSTLALKNQIFPYADNPYILPEDGLVAD